jgi:ParB family transcriptional regulator, chromosome partitioning protein
MQLEFHQLDRRWEHLRVRHPGRQRRLLASLAESGQQMPIVVIATAGQPDRYLVIDGYKRIAALQQLGRDTVEAVVWPMGEAEALLLDRSLRLAEHETPLEQGWLLVELEQRFGYGLDELARRFDRSVSWISRRLALVELLPESIQQQVRDGALSAHVAMKCLVPAARIHVEDCERMAGIFVQYHCDTRQAAELYAAWRKGSAVIRKRILDAPELFFKTQRQVAVQPPATAGGELLRDLEIVTAIVNRAHRRLAGAASMELDNEQREAARDQVHRIQSQLRRIDQKILWEQEVHVEPSAKGRDSGTAQPGSQQAGDSETDGSLASHGAQGAAVEGCPGPGVAASREGRTPPATHPGASQQLQGESRASP